MTPTILINPDENQVTNAVEEFNSLLSNGASIHPVALSRLKNPRHEFSNPFPRIESHDDYLFGVLATPRSLLDGEDLFVTLTFIASLKKIRDDLQTSAQHKLAAIASIMLLPTFIAGLFGQNFRFGEEMEKHWGLTILSVLIVLTTIMQYFYFKRNKWL